MRQPVIGITTSQAGIHPEPSNSYKPYFAAVENSGGVPYMIGLDQPIGELDALLSKLDGLIFSGGGDVQTSLYHGDMKLRVEGVLKERDNLELELIQKALASDLPVLGICRGVQVLNVALGGTLITDIPAQRKSSIEHSNPYPEHPREMIAHEVTLAPGSRLAAIYQASPVSVNSRHHQAIDTPAKGSLVTARATDDLIEAIELKGYRFALGVQWHPENLQSLPGHQNLIKAFIAAASV